MRRRFAALLAAVLAGGTLAVLAPSGPASATTACVLVAVPANVTPGLLYPIGAPKVTTTGDQTTVSFNNQLVFANWNIGNPVGTQVCTSGTFAAAGTLLGYCGHSTG